MADKYVRIGIDATPAEEGKARVVSIFAAISAAAKETGGDIGKVESSLSTLKEASESAGSSLDAMKEHVESLRGALELLAAVEVAKTIYEIADAFEMLRVQLTTAMGSLEDAETALAGIKQFALTTPFTVQDLTQSFVMLRNIGLQPTTEVLTGIGNTASAMGKQFGNTAEAFMMAAMGMGRGLKQYGIEIQTSGDQAAVTFHGQTTVIKNDAAQIFDYLVKLGNTQFAGSMDRMMGTTSGQISNLKDAFGQLADAIGHGPLLDAIMEFVKHLTDMVKSAEEVGKSLGSALASGVRALDEVVQFLAGHWDELKAAILGVAVAVGVFYSLSLGAAIFEIVGAVIALVSELGVAGAAMAAFDVIADANPFGLLAAGIGLIVGGLYYLRDATIEVGGQTTTVRDTLTAAWQLIGESAEKTVSEWAQAFSAMKGGEEGATANMSSGWDRIKAAALSAAQGSEQAWIDAHNVIIAVFTSLYDIEASVVTRSAQLGADLYSVFEQFFQQVMTLLQPFVEVFETAWNGIKVAATALWEDVKSYASAAWDAIVSIAKIAVGALISALEPYAETITMLWGAIRQYVQNVWEDIRAWVVSKLSAMLEYFQPWVDIALKVFQPFQTFWQNVSGDIDKALSKNFGSGFNKVGQMTAAVGQRAAEVTAERQLAAAHEAAAAAAQKQKDQEAAIAQQLQLQQQYADRLAHPQTNALKGNKDDGNAQRKIAENEALAASEQKVFQMYQNEPSALLAIAAASDAANTAKEKGAEYTEQDGKMVQTASVLYASLSNNVAAYSGNMSRAQAIQQQNKAAIDAETDAGKIQVAMIQSKLKVGTDAYNQDLQALTLKAQQSRANAQYLSDMKDADKTAQEVGKDQASLATGIGLVAMAQAGFGSEVSKFQPQQWQSALGIGTTESQALSEALTKAKSGQAGFADDIQKFDPRAWLSALFDAGTHIDALGAAITKVKPGTDEWNQLTTLLAAAQEQYNTALEKTPDLLKFAEDAKNAPANQAALAESMKVGDIEARTRAVMQGSQALAAYDLQQKLINAEMEAYLSVLPKIGDKEGDLEARRLAAMKAARTAILDQYQGEIAQVLQKPFDDFVTNAENSGMQLFETLFQGGYKHFSDLWKAVQQSFLQLVSQLIAEWTKAQFVAYFKMLPAAGQSGPGGTSTGGAGSAASQLPGVGPVSPGQGAIIGLGAGVGGAIGGAIGGTGGAIAGSLIGAGLMIAATGVGVVVGVVVAVVGILVGIIAGIIGNEADWAKIDIGVQQGQVAVVQMRGVQGRIAQLSPVASALVTGVNAFITSLGAVISTTNSSVEETIGRTGHKDNTNYFVQYANGLVANFGTDSTAAMNFAMVQALKAAPLIGLDPLTAAVIKNSVATSLDDLQKQIDVATQINQLGQGSTTQSFDSIVTQMNGLRASITALLPPSQELTDALNKITAGEKTQIQALRNQILGISETPAQQLDDAINEFNDAIDQEVQNLQQQDANAAQDAQTAVTNANAGYIQVTASLAQLKAAGQNTDAVAGMLVAANANIAAANSNLTAANTTTQNNQAFIQWLESQKITPGEEQTAQNNIKNTATKGTNPKQQVIDDLKQSAEGQQSAYLQALDQINDKWDADAKLAGKDAALLQQVTAARNAEIAALQKQYHDQAVQNSQDFINKGDQSAGGQLQQSFDSINTSEAALIQANRDLAKQGVLTTAELHKLNQEIRDSADAQKAALTAQVLTSVGQFIAAGSNTQGIEDLASEFSNVDTSATNLIQQLQVLAANGQITTDQMNQLTAAIKASAQAQKEALANSFADNTLEEMYNLLGDQKDAEQLKWQMQLAELQAKRAELQIAVEEGYLQQGVLDTFDTLYQKIVAAGPSLLDNSGSGDTGGGDASGGGSYEDSLSSFQQTLQQLNESDLDETTQKFVDLINKFQALQVQATQLGEGIDQVNAAYTKAVQQFWQETLQPIKDLMSSLLMGSDSPLSQQDKLSAAQSAFTDLITRYQAGDLSVVSQIPQAAQNLLDAAHTFYASGPQYEQLFDYVMGILQSLGPVNPQIPAGALTGDTSQTGGLGGSGGGLPPGYVPIYNTATGQIIGYTAPGEQLPSGETYQTPNADGTFTTPSGGSDTPTTGSGAHGEVVKFADGTTAIEQLGFQLPAGAQILATFAQGGITSKPAIFGDNGPEAAVPLPDGRSIPVTFTTPVFAPWLPPGGNAPEGADDSQAQKTREQQLREAKAHREQDHKDMGQLLSEARLTRAATQQTAKQTARTPSRAVYGAGRQYRG